jgi:hypothetical protein
MNDSKAATRILMFLAKGMVVAADMADAGKLMLDGGDRGAISVSRGDLEVLAANGFLTREANKVSLSLKGAAHVKALRADVLGAATRELEPAIIVANGADAVALVNLSESPLGQLVRRKARDGRPFLTGREYDAGERLRADYTRGQLIPRLGANWMAGLASGRRIGGPSGAVEITEAALAARQRVDNAIRSVGPELSGVLIDVCCFLKGLEKVESERGWPIRSAKIILKTALGVLSRHYYPERAEKPRGSVLHWGVEGYRPSIS